LGNSRDIGYGLKGVSEVVAAIAILGVTLAAISLYLFAVGGIASGSMPGNPSLLVTASEFTKVGSTYYASIRVSAIGSKAIIKALELYDPYGNRVSLSTTPSLPINVSPNTGTEIMIITSLATESQQAGQSQDQQDTSIGVKTINVGIGITYRSYVLVITYSDVYGNTYRQTISISLR
jgi:hypothetical protein